MLWLHLGQLCFLSFLISQPSKVEGKIKMIIIVIKSRGRLQLFGGPQVENPFLKGTTFAVDLV